MKTDVLLANLMLVSYMCQETPDIIKPIFEANYILYNGNRIEQGETLEAQIYLSLRKSEPIEMIRVNGDTLQIDENGMAFYEKKADKLGTFPVKASITTKTGTGQNKTITGEIRYAVKKACR